MKRSARFAQILLSSFVVLFALLGNSNAVARSPQSPAAKMKINHRGNVAFDFGNYTLVTGGNSKLQTGRVVVRNGSGSVWDGRSFYNSSATRYDLVSRHRYDFRTVASMNQTVAWRQKTPTAGNYQYLPFVPSQSKRPVTAINSYDVLKKLPRAKTSIQPKASTAPPKALLATGAPNLHRM